MPDFYQKGEYDLAGFAVGVFEKNKLINGEKINQGDVVVGLASNGLHSNGFSLVRKIFPPEKVRSRTLREQIVRPTKIYVRSILEANREFKFKGWAHITGGGLFGKLGKILPNNLSVELKRGSWIVHPIFSEIQTKGKISEREMFQTFNMGIGFAGIVSPAVADKAVSFLKKKGEEVFRIGLVKAQATGGKVILSN
jgi:phosphoribosylformylglycinamidine cyclo-ligase